jgi:fibronectin type 3 domain-containing protein
VGNTYWYQVKAVNIIGTGAASNQLSLFVSNAPLIPTNLNVALVTGTSAQLTWMDNATNEEGYRVDRADNALGPFTAITTAPNHLAVGTTTYTDGTITAGNVYYYRVVAFNTTLGVETASDVVATSTTGPISPGGPVITVNAAAPSIKLDWTDMSTNETGFKVQRAPDNAGAPGAFADLTVTPANTLTYTDTTIATGTIYWYQIVAAGSTGGVPTPDSVPTTPVSVYLPTAPTNLQLSVVTTPALSVDLTWNDTPGEDGYQIERAPDNAGVPGTWAAIGNTAQNVVSFSDTTAAANATYHYRVIATTTSWGNSGPSNVVMVLTTIPAAPMNLNASLPTLATEVVLNWSASTGATGYRVLSDAATAGTFVQIGADLPAGTTTLTDTITAGATHSYQVIAFNLVGASAPAEIAISYTPPAVPTGITTMVTGSITVTWTDNSSNEIGFSVLRAEEDPANPGQPLLPFIAVANTGNNPANPTAPNVTTLVDSDPTLIQPGNYFYQVIALGNIAVDPGYIDSTPLESTSAILNDIPAAPTTLNAAAPAFNMVSLTWVDAATNETGYRIERTGGATFAPVTQPANIHSFQDTSVAAGTAYTYTVFAVNGLGEASVGPAPVTTPVPQPIGGGGGFVGAPATAALTLSGLTGSLSVNTSSGMAQSTVVLENTNKECSLSIASGTRLMTSSGAVLSQITLIDNMSPPAAPAGKAIIGVARDFGPNGAKFDPAITIKMKYNPATLPQGVTPDMLSVAYWDGTMWQMLTSQLDQLNSMVSASITHFTTFAIVSSLPVLPEAQFSFSNLSISPSTARVGSSIEIRILVTNTSPVNGTAKVDLKVNGALVESKSVDIPAVGSANVVFTRMGNAPGTFSVDVNGLTGAFGIEAVPEPQEPPVTTPPAVTTPPVVTSPSTPTPTFTSPVPTTSATTPTPPAQAATGGFNWALVVGIIGGVIVIGLIIAVAVRRRG